MKNRFFSLLMSAVCCVVITLIPFSEAHAYTIKDGICYIAEFTGYQELDHYEVTSKYGGGSYNTLSGNIYLKDRLYGKNVTEIRFGAFSGMKGYVNIVCPSTMTKIQKHAFKNATGLMMIELNEGLTTVEKDAFMNCTGLTGILVPTTIVEIKSGTFKGCTALPGIELPNVKIIRESAFEKCKSLVSVVGRRGQKCMVQQIDRNAFKGCMNLTSIDFPKLVSIGYGAFVDCTKLSNVILQPTLTSIGDFAFKNCGLKVMTNQSTKPQKIKPNVFDGVDLSKCILYVPKGCKADYKAADVWKNFGNILEPGEQPVDTQPEETPEDEKINAVNAGLQKIGSLYYILNSDLTASVAQDTSYCSFKGKVEIPQSVKYNGYEYVVTAINKNAFSTCDFITEVVMPNTILSIGESAFYKACRMRSVTLSSSLKEISANCFYECKSLTQVTLPNTIKKLGEGAFRYCTDMTSISLPAGLDTIGDGSFSNCHNLTNVKLPGNLKVIGDKAFLNCYLIDGLTFPSTLQYIGFEILKNDSNFTAMTVNAEVPPVINKSAFEKAGYNPVKNSQQDITLYVPAGCKAAYENATGWKEIKNIVELVSKDRIKYGNLYYQLCEDKTAYVTYDKNEAGNYSNLSGEITVDKFVKYKGMEYEVTGIGQNAFRYATGITKVNLPELLDEIRSMAFNGCTNLAEINIPATLTWLDDDAFGGDTKLFVDNKDEDGAVYYDDCLLALTKKLSGDYTVKEGTRLIASNAFMDQDDLTSITLPEDMQVICNSALSDMLKLKTVTLPSTLQYIGGGFLHNCYALSSIYNYAESPYDLSDTYCFDGVNAAGCTLYVPQGSKAYYEKAAEWKDFPVMEMAPKTYTVTFVDWDGEELKTEEVEKDGYATAPPKPYRQGYDFKGWDKTFYEVTEDLTVTAQYEIAKFTVTFLDWNMKEIDTQIVEYGETAVAPPDPEREGYIFTGWGVDVKSYVITTDINIWANYAEKLWTVTYLNWDGELLGTEEVKDGEAAKGMVATKVGWIFDYWYNTKNFETEDLKKITKDLTVKAQFTYEVLFSVTYRVEGVTTFEIQAVYGFDVSKIYYNPKDLPKVPQKESDAMYDYTFAGWTPEVEYLTNNVVLEAVFESTLRKYTVSFYDWDDKLIETQEVEYGKDANAPTPERTGYTFNGWDKRIDDVTENLSVKAQYNINIYSVTFVDWDGNVLRTAQMVEYGNAAVPPSDPVRAGYKFDGWDQDFSSVTSDMTVVATYVKMYVVNFVDWDGTILSTQNVESDKDAHAPADPTREGYEFTGWDTDYTHVSSDLTVNAKYEVNTYKVTLTSDHGTITITEDVNPDAVPWGTVLHLTAVPDEGYEFVKWTNYNPEKGLEVKSDVNVTASFTIKIFTVRFLDWDGTMLKTDQIVEYGKPAIAPTDPTRDGYEFTGWDKEFGNITSNLTVTAQYQVKSFTITALSADANMGTVTGGGVYEYNSQVSITAVPAEGYLFKQWNDGNTDNPRSITVTKDATYTAEFEQKQPEVKYFTITVVSANETMGTVLGGGTYKEGSEVQIVAVPKDGYKFMQWNDGNTANPRTVTVSKDETYTATFAEAVAPHTTYTITVISADEGMGSVMGGGTYDEGSTVFIAALANDGYKFLKWQDGNTDNPRSVTVTKDEIFIASFEKIQDNQTYTLTLVALPEEGGTVIGAGTYEEGATAVVAASPAEGWEFFGWSDGVQDQARQIVMDKDIVLIANFHKIGEGLEAVSSQQSAVSRKVLIDGHVYIILPDGTTYDTNGKVVK